MDRWKEVSNGCSLWIKMPEAINRGDAKEMKKEKLNARPRKVLVCFFQQLTFSSHADTHVRTQNVGVEERREDR